MRDINRRKVTNPNATSTNISQSQNNISNNRRRTTTPLLKMSTTVLLISVTILGFFINDVSTLVHFNLFFVFTQVLGVIAVMYGTNF